MSVPAFKVWVPDAGTPAERYCAACKLVRHSTFHDAYHQKNGRPVGALVSLCELCWYNVIEQVTK